MSSVKNPFGDPWPALSYSDFAATQHLLHMGLQAIGKLKLQEPFQPQWAQVPLWVIARRLTTGPIPYSGGAYEVTADGQRPNGYQENYWFALAFSGIRASRETLKYPFRPLSDSAAVFPDHRVDSH